jgi:hypothetical protein
MQALHCGVTAHGSGLPGGALDRAHNALVGSAATDIRVHVATISSRVGFALCLSRSAALMIWPD